MELHSRRLLKIILTENQQYMGFDFNKIKTCIKMNKLFSFVVLCLINNIYANSLVANSSNQQFQDNDETIV